ncbi:MAG: 4'-phosphopantetheinyl transferase superfamily protein [Bacteroidales bacterium]|jgi:4'-phosphopantetheinyl transferase|nr:4'-phosphopantetheinyl transferase superfamily protein [Bacteroidales bacterium]MDD2204209.1 4'-phosphopantetheinyl transferase superfamily protein [Bacteroidales bacterium]MDD3152856.1 4'-phosphopantetheinyl transferase superfamily protein [Bacteroidales bacterium]MDD3913618.1 4'-phosphopantetheinyl transferase superfamily protein [Bacteroidales bacterium]MDD4633614.1 4'-phosphopantetheinyl transferase superfamily protein [Bacteroidales bacterium]
MNKFYIEYLDISKPIADLDEYVGMEEIYMLQKTHTNETSFNHSLFGRYLLRKALSKIDADNFKSYKIKFGDNGKPYIEDVKDFYFNISHSYKAVSIIVSEKECGIDIEKIGFYKRDIAKRFFHIKEYNYLETLDKELQSKEFYRIWTQKEAVVKYLGGGLSIGLDSFYIEKNKVINSLDNMSTACLSINSFIKTFSYEDYYVSYCIKI